MLHLLTTILKLETTRCWAYLVFLDEDLDGGKVLAVVLRHELMLHLVHPGQQVVHDTVELQRLIRILENRAIGNVHNVTSSHFRCTVQIMTMM